MHVIVGIDSRPSTYSLFCLILHLRVKSSMSTALTHCNETVEYVSFHLPKIFSASFVNVCFSRCCSLDDELISAGTPALVVGVWGNTRATAPLPRWKSMIPYSWGCCARDGIIVKWLILGFPIFSLR